jgi:AzlC protein
VLTPDGTASAAGRAGTADASTSTGTGAGTAGGARAGAAVKRWLVRLIGTHLITDESVAFALRQDGRSRRRAAFWACGAALFVIWNVSVLLGVALGSALHVAFAFGLDSTFPAVMLALALPTMTSRSIKVAAGTGAVIAVALTAVLPAGLPLLAALGGLGTRWTRWTGWTGWTGWRGLLRRPSLPRDGAPDGANGAGGAANDGELTAGGRR